MSEHTPGPWEWSEAVPLPGVEPDKTDPNPRAWPLWSEGGDGCAVLRHQAPWPVDEADARLIAAAPDLLAACKALIGQLDGELNWPKRDKAVAEIRAAIAKAEGREA